MHEGYWPPIPDAVSPSAREGGVFRAHEPDRLVGRPLSLKDATLAEAARVEQLIGDLGDLGVGLERFFLRLEAIASTRLKRQMASPYDVVSAELALEDRRVVVDDPVGHPMAWHVVALRMATEELARDGQVTVAGLDRVQRLLLTDEPHLQGVRADQNWVGGRGPVGAAYVPPPPAYVGDLMADLAAYLDAAEHPVLVQAALAYAQLEMISPFRAGNGRVGRALIATVLRRRGLTPAYVLPVSVPMLGNHIHRARVLEWATYEGPVSSQAAREVTDDWVDTFLGPAEAAVHTVRAIVAEVNRIRARWQEVVSRLQEDDPQPDADAVVVRLLPLLPEQPILTPDTAAAELHIPPERARQALERLRAGVVGKSPVGPGVEGYFAIEVLELMAEAVHPTSETRSLYKGRPMPSGYNYYAHGGVGPHPDTGYVAPPSSAGVSGIFGVVSGVLPVRGLFGE